MKKYSSKLGFKQSNGCLPHPSQLEDLLNEWAGCRWNRGVSWLKSGLSWALFYWVICGRHVSCHFAEAASDKIHWMELDCHWCVGGIRGTTDRWQNPSMWGCRWGINEQEELGWGRTAPPPLDYVKLRTSTHSSSHFSLERSQDAEQYRTSEKKYPTQFQYDTNGPHHANIINNGPFSSVNIEQMKI